MHHSIHAIQSDQSLTELNVADVVKIKGQPIRMTILRFKSISEKPYAEVVWFNKNREIRTKTISVEFLEKVGR